MKCVLARALATALLFAAVAGQAQSGPPVIFSDGTFDDADWSVVTFATGPGSSVVAGQSAADGNPPPGRRVRNVLGPAASPSEASNVYVAHLSSRAVYDPSTQGPIATVDFLVDAILLDGFGDGQGIGLALRQNDMVYIRQAGGTPDRAWTRKESLGVAANGVVYLSGAVVFDPMQHPDFTAGGPIEFGFFTANSTLGGSGYEILAAYDNWTVRVNNPCASPVECQYPDPCLVGACQSGKCVATPTPCDDGDACTSDACVAGACAFTPVACDDGVSCTRDACATGACQSTVDSALIDAALDQLLAAVEAPPCADDVPGKLRRKLVKKLEKAQKKLVNADAAEKAKLINNLLGRADSLLGVAQTLLAAGQASGLVSAPCASTLSDLLTDAAGCVAALPRP
jgi:hypothetical protein